MDAWRPPWGRIAKLGAGLAFGIALLVPIALSLLVTTGSAPPVPVVAPHLPAHAVAGRDWEARLTITDPTSRLVETYVESEVGLIIERELPTVVAAYLLAPNFKVTAGQPDAQSLRSPSGAAEWAWTLSSEAELRGSYDVEIRVFESANPDAQVKLGTIERTITIESACSGRCGFFGALKAFFLPVGISVVGAIIGGGIMVIIGFYGLRYLQRRHPTP